MEVIEVAEVFRLMKRTVPVGFVALVLLPILNAPALWATPTQPTVRTEAKPKRAPIISRENFVALSWEQSGGFAGLITTLKVEGNVLSYSSAARELPGGRTGNFIEHPIIPETQGVSNHQLDSLIAKLNQTHVAALVGNYRQPNLADGFQEVLVLTISDKNDQDHQFIIENYGDTAPKGYAEFTTFFRTLVGKKFPHSPFAPAAPVKTPPQ